MTGGRIAIEDRLRMDRMILEGLSTRVIAQAVPCTTRTVERRRAFLRDEAARETNHPNGCQS